MDDLAEEIFTQVLELEPRDREKFIEEACAGCGALRQRVEQLLRDAEGADAYFTGSFGGAPWAGSPGDFLMEREGDWVGPYKLLQQIGEGGFGVVWMAEQDKPISRRVAVKVIKAGMDTKEVLSRFDAERQALARMDHPNIARVLDAGATQGGRPFFAMELVKGLPITRFCDERTMDASARLLLFTDVCAAINHAHQKGVIHRDIKPSNVLVTLDGDRPLVKVIDFGISKATEGKLTDQTLFTRIEQWVGTPVYMSPEQAGLGSLDIDTRSDIYGLGVLLYELLTGVPPFEQATLLKSGHEEMRRIIREVEPLRPSLRLTSLLAGEIGSITAVRQVSKDQLRRFIASDLDWIVMKAIDKSRDRRYATAAAFADDIGRFLADEPVAAKPPGAFYLFSKFSKRHRVGIQVACGIGLLLLGTTLFSSWQAVRAIRAEDLARGRLEEVVSERNAKTRALQDAEDVSGLLTEVFKRPNPEVDGRTVTVVEALDAASGKLDTELAAQPERLAMLQEVLASTYEGLALYENSLALREKVLAIRRRHLGIEHHDSLRSLRQVIENAERLGKFSRARELAEEELPLVRSRPGSEKEPILLALRSLANSCFHSGDRTKAIEVQQEAIELNRNTYGDLSREVALARWHLSQYTQADGDPRKDGTSNEKPQAADVMKTVAPGAVSKPHPAILPELQKAEEEFSTNRATYGASHLRTLEAQSRLAQLQIKHGLTDLGIANQIQLLALAQKEFTPLSETSLKFHCQLADRYSGISQAGEAFRVQEQAVNLLRERDGANAPSTIEAEDHMMRFMFYANQGERYRTRLKEVYERRTKALGPADQATLGVQSDLILNLYYSPEFLEAITHGELALPIMRKSLGPENRITLDTMNNLARCYSKAGRTREAIELLAEACPHTCDDTWVNFLLANLQLWCGLREDYNATRKWMLADILSHRTSTDILERAVWICCLNPLENKAQGQGLLLTLKRVQGILAAPGAMPQTVHPADVSHQIDGLLLYRTEDFANALEQFDKAARVLDSDRKANPQTGKPKHGNWVRFYKAMTLQRLGRESEAKTLFCEAALDMKSEPLQEKPLLNVNDPDGTSLLVWLAYREAKETFEPTVIENRTTR